MFPDLVVALGRGDARIDYADVLGLRAAVARCGDHQSGKAANAGAAGADDAVLGGHDTVVLFENVRKETVRQRQSVHHINVCGATKLLGSVLRDAGSGAQR